MLTGIPAILLEVSLRSLCLALAAWIALRLFRVRDAAQQHTVWTVVLGAMLLMPLLVLFVPSLSLHVLPAGAAPAAQWLVPSPSPSPIPSAGTPVEIQPVSARPVATSAYGLVTLAMLLHLAVSWLAAVRLLRRGAIIEDARAHAILAALASGPRLPVLRESEDLTMPVSFGWLSPAVLLPASWRSWDDAKLRAVLAHEFAHVQRRDALVRLLAALNRCLFWFHPLSWWLARHLAALAEHVSDDAAVLATGDRHKYAQVLVEIAAAAGTSGRRLLACGSAMARSSQVRRRVERILALRRGAARGARWLVLAPGLPLVYFAAAIQLAPGQPPPPPPPAPVGAFPLPSDLEMLGQGWRLSAADATQLEQHLKLRPDDVESRMRLITYYFLNAVPSPRLEHIFWLIENRPDSPAFDHRGAWISASASPLNDTAAYERAKTLWRAQAERYSNNARVQANAAAAIQETDPLLAESYLQRARSLEPHNPAWTERLARLYARPSGPGSFFATKGRLLLESSNDAALVGAAGEQLVRFPSADLREFGERLLQRARSLDPGNLREHLRRIALARPNAAPRQPPPPPPPAPAAQLEQPVTSVPPVYPPLARQAGIQGAVRLRIVVGADGRPERIQLVSGHPTLVHAAIEAVRQWVFRANPAGRSVEVEVPFRLDSAGAVPPPQQGSIFSVQADYPALARQARIQGTVRFRADVAADGRATRLQLISGHPLLIPAALKAVQEAEFQTAAGAQVHVEVPFRLDE